MRKSRLGVCSEKKKNVCLDSICSKDGLEAERGMLTIFKYLEDGHVEEEFMIRWLFRLDPVWHHGKQKDCGINIKSWLYYSFVMYLYLSY